MTNPYYNPTGTPGQRAILSSAAMRGELALIGQGFDDVDAALTAVDATFVRIVDAVMSVDALSLGLINNAVILARGRTASGDGGGGIFRYLDSSTATADNGLVFTPSVGPGRIVRDCWTGTDFPVVKVEWYGAKADDEGGAGTDSYAAIAAALASPWTRIVEAAGMYYCSAGLTVNGQRALVGRLSLSNQDATSGSCITFANGVAKCLKITSGSNATAGAEMLTIARRGVAGASTIGVEVFEAAMIVLGQINSVNHGHLYNFEAHGASGISCELQGCHGHNAVTSFFRANNWPELKINGGRYGVPGANNYNCDSFFLITGDDTSGSSGIGPNTIILTGGVNMNQGDDGPKAFALWNAVGTAYGNQVSFTFDDAHIEGVTEAIFRSTSTAPYLTRLTMANTTVNCPPAKMFDLHADTLPTQVKISNSFLFVGETTLAPAGRIDDLNISDSTIDGLVTLDPGGLNNVGVLNGNTYIDGLVVSGDWALLQISGLDVADNIDTTATTGNVVIWEPRRNALKTFTPLLAFGGATTGVVQSQSYGVYQINGNTCSGQFYVVLTNKGSATGVAAIYGTIPLPSIIGYSLGGGGVAHYIFNMTGLTSPVLTSVGYDGASAPIVSLSHYGATGAAALTQANFTNTSVIAGNFSYVIKPQ